MSEQPFNFPLEDLITTAANAGCKSMSLVFDKDGRYQASVQKGNSSTFKVHVANNPVQALYGALGGIDGLKVFDAIASIKFYVLPKPTDEPVVEKVVESEADTKKMTYWYHPESDCVWAHLGEFPPEMEARADVMLSNQITKEEYDAFMGRPKISDAEMDDLL